MGPQGLVEGYGTALLAGASILLVAGLLALFTLSATAQPTGEASNDAATGS